MSVAEENTEDSLRALSQGRAQPEELRTKPRAILGTYLWALNQGMSVTKGDTGT